MENALFSYERGHSAFKMENQNPLPDMKENRLNVRHGYLIQGWASLFHFNLVRRLWADHHLHHFLQILLIQFSASSSSFSFLIWSCVALCCFSLDNADLFFYDCEWRSLLFHSHRSFLERSSSSFYFVLFCFERSYQYWFWYFFIQIWVWTWLDYSHHRLLWWRIGREEIVCWVRTTATSKIDSIWDYFNAKNTSDLQLYCYSPLVIIV